MLIYTFCSDWILRVRNLCALGTNISSYYKFTKFYFLKKELSSSGRMDHLTSEVLGLHFLDYSIESTDIRISHPQTSFKVRIDLFL
jgi:hypothetical protein